MNYYDIDALSYSSLKELSRSPKYFYYKYILKNLPKIEETFALREGRAFDLLITEPEKFGTAFEIVSGVKTTTRENCITDSQFNNLLNMKNELLNSYYSDREIYLKDLFPLGKFQQPILWKDSKYNLPCKAKPDWLASDFSLMIDIKTIASIKNIYRDFFYNYDYNIQAAMYIRAVQHIYEATPKMIFIFIEKSFPYDVEIIDLSIEGLLTATQKLENLFETYLYFIETDSWLGTRRRTL